MFYFFCCQPKKKGVFSWSASVTYFRIKFSDSLSAEWRWIPAASPRWNSQRNFQQIPGTYPKYPKIEIWQDFRTINRSSRVSGMFQGYVGVFVETVDKTEVIKYLISKNIPWTFSLLKPLGGFLVWPVMSFPWSANFLSLCGFDCCTVVPVE